MADSKVGGDVEEMNTIAGLGSTQTNMAEDSPHPTKKPITRAAEMMNITHHLSQAALEELCVGWEAIEEAKEESLFIQNGPFSGSLATGKKQSLSQRP